MLQNTVMSDLFTSQIFTVTGVAVLSWNFTCKIHEGMLFVSQIHTLMGDLFASLLKLHGN